MQLPRGSISTFQVGPFFFGGSKFGQLAKKAAAKDKESPADGVIVGIGKVDGRRVAVINYDFTVIRGSQGKINHVKTDHILKVALEQSIPIVFLLDGGRARAQDMELFPDLCPDLWHDQARVSGWVPMAAAG